SCVNISIPNVIGLSKCLGTSGDLCSSDTKGAVNLIGKLVVCALEGIADLDLAVQLPLIEQLLTHILEDAGLGPLAKLLFSLCKTTGGLLGGILGGVGDLITSILPLKELNKLIKSLTGALKCSGLDVNKCLNCDELIVLNLPSALNIG
ncbi:hypothetical protein HPB47_021347, partial [Ixodes persulcatus]